MKQPHEHPIDATEKLLITGILVSFLIFGLELVGGFMSHSLALLSDAWHIFIDIWALAGYELTLAVVPGPTAGQPSADVWPASDRSVMAALINSFTVFVIAAGILSVRRPRRNGFIIPPDVHGQVSAGAGFAGLGLALNLMVAALFYKQSAHDLNIRGAFIHQLGDARMNTVAVLIAVGSLFY